MSSSTAAEPAYDLVVIGAGINGLGIARDAAARGLRVAVVEKDDLCSGVSAWSGRLVHGGLRYLEHGEIPLVRESLKERERLFRLAPHLVKPVRLLMPFFAKNKRPPWMIRIGMIGYDVLSFDKQSPWHRILDRRAIEQRFPGIERDGLSGSAMFTDGQLEYAERLCVELAVGAAADGARILTHTAATGLPAAGGRVTGVSVRTPDGRERTLPAKVVVNAAGPWVDWVLGNPNGGTLRAGEKRHIGGAKGTHVIVDDFPGAPKDVVYYESQADQRLVLVIPWMGRFLIGCTDSKFEDDPDEARAESEEVEYLLKEVNTLVPGAHLTEADVLYTYSGVRPLPHRPGVPEWARAAQPHPARPRQGGQEEPDLRHQRQADHLPPAGGGRGRPGAEAPGPQGHRLPTRDLAFPGARVADLAAFTRDFVATAPLERDVAARLVDLYGTRAESIVALQQAEPALARRLSDSVPLIAAEVAFVVDTEFALSVADVFARRTLLAFEPGHGLDAVDEVADVMAERLGWDAGERQASIEDYRRWLGHLAVPAPVAARAERVGA